MTLLVYCGYVDPDGLIVRKDFATIDLVGTAVLRAYYANLARTTLLRTQGPVIHKRPYVDLRAYWHFHDPDQPTDVLPKKSPFEAIVDLYMSLGSKRKESKLAFWTADLKLVREEIKPVYANSSLNIDHYRDLTETEIQNLDDMLDEGASLRRFYPFWSDIVYEGHNLPFKPLVVPHRPSLPSKW